MKTKLFLDTNIVIDYIAHRAHFLSAATLMDMGYRGEVELYITRNEKHFRFSTIPVMGAMTYLNGTSSNYTLEEDGNFIVNEPMEEYHPKK